MQVVWQVGHQCPSLETHTAAAPSTMRGCGVGLLGAFPFLSFVQAAGCLSLNEHSHSSLPLSPPTANSDLILHLYMV